MLTLGERIRQLREEKDISLRELAKAIRVSPAFLSDVELGRRQLSDEHIVSLAASLETTREELQKYDTRPPMRDLRRMTAADPEYGFAFRQLIDKKISAQDLIDFIKKSPKKEDGSKDKK